MLVFQWQDKYMIGEEQIDHEHRRLFHLANEIIEMRGEPVDVEKMREAVKALFFYMETHFESEEAFMLKCNYPNRREHRLKHQQIIAEMNSALKHFDSVDAYLRLLHKMMIYWVVEHITDDDAKIGKWLRETGQGRELSYAATEA